MKYNDNDMKVCVFWVLKQKLQKKKSNSNDKGDRYQANDTNLRFY